MLNIFNKFYKNIKYTNNIVESLYIFVFNRQRGVEGR